MISRLKAFQLVLTPKTPLANRNIPFQFNARNGNFFDDMPSDAYRSNENTSDMDYNSSLNLDNVPQSPTEAYASLSPEEFEEHVPKINSVTLVGRIGQNPEPRYFDDGKVVLRLGLAVKRKYHPLERQVKNIKYGEEETDWFNLELWGRDAEYATKYITKGARVGVTGSVNVDTWTDRMTGEEKTSVKIVVKQLDILETKAEAELRQGKQPGGNSKSYGYDSDYRYGNNDSAGEDGPSSGGSGGFFDD
jgi:single-strand DNA-binding protein